MHTGIKLLFKLFRFLAMTTFSALPLSLSLKGSVEKKIIELEVLL